jgi:AmiR/NasT family two-component response regulator
MMPSTEGSSRAEFAKFDAVVAMRRDEDAEFLIRELQHTRAQVRHVWPLPDRLPEDTDVVFCGLEPGLPGRIPWVPGEPKAALVVVLASGIMPDLDLLVNSAPDAVLYRPITRNGVLVSLVLARNHFAYDRRLRWRINKLDESLRGMRAVERAKQILMHTRQMGEEEAYRFMRGQAMKRRAPISAIAATIIDSHEMLS